LPIGRPAGALFVSRRRRLALSAPVQLVLKGLAGGTFVVAFALIGSVVKPKRFAGLFSAAPSVAIASLLIAAYAVGVSKTDQDARSMILGAVAMIVASVLGLPLLGRLSALRTASCIAGFWFAAAALGYMIVLR
jgi:uncharacterized membrane protein (GlpM family)